MCSSDLTVPASLAAGDASTIEYGFIVPVEERGSVSIIVDSGSQARAAIFQGEAIKTCGSIHNHPPRQALGGAGDRRPGGAQ